MHDVDLTNFGFKGETFNYEFGDGARGSTEVFDEAELVELASELLEVQSDDEMDQFFGGLIKNVGKAVGKVVSSPLGQQLGGAIKSTVKNVMSQAGTALGNIIQGQGGQIAQNLLGSMFGGSMELEGLSPEDRDLEVAKQVVRLAADATKQALTTPTSTNPQRVVGAAIQQAIQKYAPGVAGKAVGARGARSGRWTRRGNNIVLHGV